MVPGLPIHYCPQTNTENCLWIKGLAMASITRGRHTGLLILLIPDSRLSMWSGLAATKDSGRILSVILTSEGDLLTIIMP